MTTRCIEALTPERLYLLPHYRQKWQCITFQREPINLSKATEAIEAIYHFIRLSLPEVTLLPSPVAGNSASRTLSEIEAVNMIRKAQVKEIEQGDTASQVQFIKAIFGTAC